MEEKKHVKEEGNDIEQLRVEQLRDRIRRISILPERFKLMLEQALLTVKDPNEREALCKVACVVSNHTWQHWQAWRSAEDNRQEHEWVVFANVMKIAESERLTLSEKRIATAFCFLHDTAFIKRIMEEEIRKLKGEKAKEKMKQMKNKQRTEHMEGGAENAEFLLKQLKDPDNPTEPLLTRKEVERCVSLIRKHDAWKMYPPDPPSTNDRLALVCLEGDVLWPLHPIGVLADLERPNQDGSEDLFEPLKWKEKLQQSIETLKEFRSKWNIPSNEFIDEESIFRTKEGCRLFSGWKELWNL